MIQEKDKQRDDRLPIHLYGHNAQPTAMTFMFTFMDDSQICYSY